VQDEFRVRESTTGYCVELFRDGEPYVTFVDGLTLQGAEREARSLTALWVKISMRPPTAAQKTNQRAESLNQSQYCS
jgi:hypothetical protein